MPRMNGTGPEGKGPKTGRRLGKCKNGSKEEPRQRYGKGMGKRHKGSRGEGRGKHIT